LSKLSHEEDLDFSGSRDDVPKTVKLDNTLEYKCRTKIYLAAVPCNGMKKELPWYFAAVTPLIISTGTAQTETLSNKSLHLKKVARQTGLHSWRCDNCNNNKRKKPLHSIAYLSCFLELKFAEIEREK
jgi:hypothetical protein